MERGGSRRAWVGMLAALLFGLGFPAMAAETVTVKGTTKAFNYNGASGSISFSVAGGTSKGTYAVTASSDKDWIVIDPLSVSQTVTLGSKGTANKSVKYRVSPYTSYSLTPRSGVITIDKNKYFTVTQTGVGCKVAIAPTSYSYFGGGENGLFSVTAPDGCGWNAAVDPAAEPWIEIEGSASGTGAGSVAFAVASNDTTRSRTGKIYVTPDVANPSRRTYTAKQAKGSPPQMQVELTITPDANTYSSPQTITISATPSDAEIYYTTDGSVPSTSSTRYSDPFLVSTTTTVRAIAVKAGWRTADEVSRSYTISGGGTGASCPAPGATLTVHLTSSVTMDFVCVRAGTFQMGGNAYHYEQPVHTVTLTRDFWLGKYEVTQGQWKAMSGGSNPSWFWLGDNWPVDSVSWNDFQVALAALNTNTGRAFRLPTEAEWEFAARGGTLSQGYAYAGSNNVNAVAWYPANSEGKSHAVGGKAPNELGLYDMSGNVGELVQDWYGHYPSGPVSDPQGPSTGVERVRRGGSWNTEADDGRLVEYRDDYNPAFGAYFLGFRLALDP